MTKKDLADLTGYSAKQIYRIDRERPEGKKLYVLEEDGKCNAAVFVQRWTQYMIERERRRETEDYEKIKAQHEAVKMQKTQIEVDRMRERLIDVNDARRSWEYCIRMIEAELLKLPERLAPETAALNNAAVIMDLWDREIRDTFDTVKHAPLPEWVEDREKETAGEGQK